MTDEPFNEERERRKSPGSYERAQRDRLRKQLRDLGVEPDDQHPYGVLTRLAGTDLQSTWGIHFVTKTD